jgi:hypothetical protein
MLPYRIHTLYLRSVVHRVVLLFHRIHSLHLHHMDILPPPPRWWFIGWFCPSTIFIPSTFGLSILYISTCSLRKW